MEEEQLNNPGALLDTRSEEEKAKDYVFSEIVSAVEPVVWVEKPQSEWRKFPVFSQNGSGSCVAQTLRKLYGVYLWLKTGVWVDISASHIYQRRQNRPSAGMAGVDAFEIARKGTTLEQFAPSEKMTDAQMDSVKVIPFMEKIGETFKLGAYVTVSPTDIDTIASIIQKTGKAVMVWFYFNNNKEWVDVPVVKDQNLVLYAQSTNRHSVAAVDFTLWKGEKALVIDDSWGLATAMNGQRIITERFFKKRNFFAAHFQNFAFEEAAIVKPTHKFEKDLKFGQTNADIVKLQDILKYEGLFATNVASSGYYGAVTAKAVLAFRTKHGVSSASDITGNSVGPLTRAKLNELYGK